MLICIVLWSFISFLLVTRYVVSTAVVVGRSMYPTLREGDRFLVDRLSHRLVGLQRGDLVLLREKGDRLTVVKRIIGLPGETLRLHEGYVELDGRRLNEAYVAPGAYTYSREMRDTPVHLGPREYFVLGDNRLWSLDSRWYGPVTDRDILGTIRP